MSKPAQIITSPFFTHPVTGKSTALPESITLENEELLTFKAQKRFGWSIGGWYEDEAGKKFMVKFGDAFCYAEKLLTDLARICTGEEFAAEKSLIGHGIIEGKSKPCFAISQIDGYTDLDKIKSPDDNAAASIALQKQHATKFHRFYAFNALIANDDLHGENLGLAGGEKPFIIDYGLTPTFLYPEQIADAATPFHLASFIGHRNLNTMQLVRRRTFGHDDFLNPDDRLKPQAEKLKAEDISYLSVLNGIRAIIEKRAEIIGLAQETLKKVQSDETLDKEDKKSYAEKYSRFAEIVGQRIDWMRSNFAEDLAMLDDAREREGFGAIKWRLHPKFTELMEVEGKAFKQAAASSLEKGLKKLSELLSVTSREEMLGLDLKTVEKSDLKEAAKFMIHDAIVAQDFEMVKWLVENEICDINQDRKLRTHNYQLFRTTPLHAAISIYHDKLYYKKTEELEPLRELIDFLREKFVEKNGASFDQSRKAEYKEQGLDGFAIEMTFTADKKYQQIASKEALSATKIQRGFRAHQATTMAAQEPSREGGR